MSTDARYALRPALAWLFALLTLPGLTAWLAFMAAIVAGRLVDISPPDGDPGWYFVFAGWLGLIAAPLSGTLALLAFRPSEPAARQRRRIALRLLGPTSILVLVTALALGVIGWVGSERAIHPPQKVEEYHLGQYQLPVEEVRFPSRDGLMLAGWFVPGSNGGTVILAHGYDRSRANLLPHADYLHRAGFSVLLFDSRGRGESEGDTVTAGVKEPLDIQGAVDYLKGRPDVDPGRIGVQGVSLGAASAIMAAAQTPEIRGVVAESAFKSVESAMSASFRHFVGLPPFPFAPITRFIVERRLNADADDVVPAKVIGRISPRPVFIIHDLKDDLVSSDSGEVLYEAAGEPKELWLVPDAEHAKGWQQAPDEYERRVVAFWRRTLGIGEVTGP